MVEEINNSIKRWRRREEKKKEKEKRIGLSLGNLKSIRNLKRPFLTSFPLQYLSLINFFY